MSKIKTKNIAEGFIQGLKEAVEHSRGQKRLKETRRELPGPAPKWSPLQIKNLRKDVYQMSQPLFAALLNVTASTVRAWEQGKKTPSGAAARLLQILATQPYTIEKLVA